MATFTTYWRKRQPFADEKPESESFMSDIVANLNKVKAVIANAEEEARRDKGSVTLVAVSKTFEAEDIRPALDAGQRVFGENRVQEAQGKWPALREAYSGIELHLIGPLQSNKAADAVALFDVIETVDREKIAAALAVEIKSRAKARSSMCRSIPALKNKRLASRQKKQSPSSSVVVTSMASPSRD